MNETMYNSKQLEDAKELAKVLISVSEDKRPLFALMVEAMIMGAELVKMGEKKAG